MKTTETTETTEAATHRVYAETLTGIAATGPTVRNDNPWGASWVTECGDYSVESWVEEDGSIYGEF